MYHPIRDISTAKRLLALILSAVMLLSTASPAMAFVVAVVTTESVFTAGEITDPAGVVRIAYGEDAQLPDGASVVVNEIVDTEAYLAAAEETLGAGQRVVASRFYEIEIVDAEGNAIQPAAPVGVTISDPDAPDEAKVNVFHYPETHSAEEEEGAEEATTEAADADSGLANAELQIEDELVPDLPAEGIGRKSLMGSRNLSAGVDDADATDSVDTDEPENKTIDIEKIENAELIDGAVTFSANGFSVYGVVYTVDFSFTSDGKIYSYSITGGSGIGLSEILPIIGVVTDDPETVEDEIHVFIGQIADVSFSNPDLMWAGKVEEATTVGGLKEAYDLNCKYSAELTEEQIADINAKTIKAGDWALISLRPFITREYMTISLKNGDSLKIKVTDAQVNGEVLTADGKTFFITVTYDDAAQIPDDTKLIAEEIQQDSDKYLQLLEKTWLEVNRDYVAERDGNQEPQVEEYIDYTHRPVNIDSARFFNISFEYNGEKVEPKAPVEVSVKLVDGMCTEAETPITGVVHFPNAGGTELISDVDTVKDENDAIVELSYEQNGFSDIGIFIAQEMQEAGLEPMDPAVALPKLTALRAGETPQLADLDAHKTLTPNKIQPGDQPDGTYTLSLSVKGDEVETQQLTKANVLIVMDRSTSMNNGTDGTAVPFTGTPENNVIYYGIDEDNKLWQLGHYTDFWGEVHWTMQRTGESTASPYNGTVYTSSNRLQAEQAALDELITALVSKNDPNDDDKKDIIEVSVVSFASQRGSELAGATCTIDGYSPKNWTGTTETGWLTQYREEETLYEAVHNNSLNNGTNWEDGLMYAKKLADDKKKDQPNEDVYIIFLTDGEPTAVYGETPNNNGYGAHHYEKNNMIYGGGSKLALGYAKYDARDGRGNGFHSPSDSTYISNAGTNFDKINTLNANGGEPWNIQDIVKAGHKFYSIFTFNSDETYSQYMKHLVNYAYGIDAFDDDPAQTQDTPTSDAYYTNAKDIAALRQSFDNIFTNIFDSLAYGDVKIVDGLTTDAMTTVLVDGKADGLKYTVKDGKGNLLYSVTASGDNSDPAVTFNLNGGNYTYDPTAGTNQVHKITKYTTTNTVDDNEGPLTKTDVITTINVGEGTTTVTTQTVVSTSTDNGETYTITSNTTTKEEHNTEDHALTIPDGAKTYYSITVGGIEYKMALADFVSTGEGLDQTKTLTWDLGPIGALKKDYTYTCEFIVWPNQGAYDYVAGLNNNLEGFVWYDGPVYDEETGELVYEGAKPVYQLDENGERVLDENNQPVILYYIGGVPDYPSIVKYPNGIFRVLTNTEQKVYYSEVHSHGSGDVITTETDPKEKELEYPDPMPLTATGTELEKAWSVNRNPSTLAQFLYNEDGTSKQFAIEYGIYRDGEEDENLYTSMILGWDKDQNKYIWEEESEINVKISDGEDPDDPADDVWRPVGTRWSEDFAIAAGLMLSEENMEERGLDTSGVTYPYFDYEADNGTTTRYYILEPGHDYTIHEIVPEDEESWVTYEFDFVAPVYHPMIVDGKLKSVEFTYKEESVVDEETGEPTQVKVISSIKDISRDDWLVSLKMENVLRGYINLEKKVVDVDGTTALPDDNTKFEYRIDLHSDLHPGRSSMTACRGMV